MAIGSGISSQVGMAAETAYGTYVPPVKFMEFNSEGIVPEVNIRYTRGLGDRVQRSSRVRHLPRGAAGPIEVDVQNKGAGFLLSRCLGTVVSAQVGATTEYTHTITPDTANGMTGMGTTVQVGRPSIDGVVRPFNYLGGKVTDWTLQCGINENLRLSTTFDFKGREEASALAAASYPAGTTAFTDLDAAITVDGTALRIKSFSLTGANALDTGRWFQGNFKREPIANGELAITGELGAEFEDLAYYNRWLAGTTAALVVTYSYGIITGAAPFKLVTTLPVVEFTGSAPTVGSSEVLQQSLPFKALSNGTDPLIRWVYHTTDVTV